MDSTGQAEYPCRYAADTFDATLQYHKAANSRSVDVGGAAEGDSACPGTLTGTSSITGDFEMLKLGLWQHLQRSTLWSLSQKFSAELAALATATSSSASSSSSSSANPLSKTFPSSLSEFLAAGSAASGFTSITPLLSDVTLPFSAPTVGCESGPFDLATSNSFGITSPQFEPAAFLGNSGVLSSTPSSNSGTLVQRDLDSVGATDLSTGGSNSNSQSSVRSSFVSASTNKSAANAPDRTRPSTVDGTTSAAAGVGTGSSTASSTPGGGNVSMSLTCYNCGLGPTTRKNLARHIRSCLGYRPYHCPLCPYAASRRDNLRRHLAIHKDMPLLETAAALAGNAMRGTSEETNPQ
ncbi:uncharacterized serine-rich protein C215.13-like isoform X2 [Varroa jacobsoni]|nr:uncharacterized serine-rich protein C215.13-like isoform X2 [Varroa jacobsoni]